MNTLKTPEPPAWTKSVNGRQVGLCASEVKCPFVAHQWKCDQKAEPGCMQQAYTHNPKWHILEVWAENLQWPTGWGWGWGWLSLRSKLVICIQHNFEDLCIWHGHIGYQVQGCICMRKAAWVKLQGQDCMYKGKRKTELKLQMPKKAWPHNMPCKSIRHGICNCIVIMTQAVLASHLVTLILNNCLEGLHLCAVLRLPLHPGRILICFSSHSF